LVQEKADRIKANQQLLPKLSRTLLLQQICNKQQQGSGLHSSVHIMKTPVARDVFMLWTVFRTADWSASVTQACRTPDQKLPRAAAQTVKTGDVHVSAS